MYVYRTNRGMGELGINPVIITAGAKFLQSLINWVFGKKPWDWRLIADSNKRAISGWFTVMLVCNRKDRIVYWLNTITEAKGIAIDSPNGRGKAMMQDISEEAWAIGRAFGFSDDGIRSLISQGKQVSIGDKASWSPPSNLVIPQISKTGTSTSSSQQQAAQTAQASVFSGILPVLLIGGGLYIVAKGAKII